MYDCIVINQTTRHRPSMEKKGGVKFLYALKASTAQHRANGADHRFRRVVFGVAAVSGQRLNRLFGVKACHGGLFRDHGIMVVGKVILHYHVSYQESTGVSQ